MGDNTKISWTDSTWNILVGCSRVSPGCDHCYAERLAPRLQGQGVDGYEGVTERGRGWTGRVNVAESRLEQPLRWTRPRRIFVNSMSDLFHESVSDEDIYRVLAVMAVADQHQYQVLTKRPKRMAQLLGDEQTPGRVAQAVDRLLVRREIEGMGEARQVEIPGFPGYWITDRGVVLLEGGSETCVWCGEAIPEEAMARARFCSQRCNSKAHYEASQGRWEEPETWRRLRPDPGEQGHLRVTMIGSDGRKHRELVHRLVLSVFRRAPVNDEQSCHRDGDPSNTALPNLRWGSQEDNWVDRIRHGHGRSHARLTVAEVAAIRGWRKAGRSSDAIANDYGISATQVRNIERGDQWAQRVDWPLPGLWAGTSIESDRYAFRARHLRESSAAVRFLSLEPLLGPLPSLDLTGIDWVIVGCESGQRARPMNENWVRDLRDRCVSSKIAFLYKQRLDERGKKVELPELDGVTWEQYPS